MNLADYLIAEERTESLNLVDTVDNKLSIQSFGKIWKTDIDAILQAYAQPFRDLVENGTYTCDQVREVIPAVVSQLIGKSRPEGIVALPSPDDFSVDFPSLTDKNFPLDTDYMAFIAVISYTVYYSELVGTLYQHSWKIDRATGEQIEAWGDAGPLPKFDWDTSEYSRIDISLFVSQPKQFPNTPPVPPEPAPPDAAQFVAGGFSLTYPYVTGEYDPELFCAMIPKCCASGGGITNRPLIGFALPLTEPRDPAESRATTPLLETPMTLANHTMELPPFGRGK